VSFVGHTQQFRFVLQILDKPSRLNNIGSLATDRDWREKRSVFKGDFFRPIGTGRTKGREMSEPATNIIDFSAYRAVHARPQSRAATCPNPMQNTFVFAAPVLMPVLVAWLPVWSMTALLAGTSTE
jgi:hypothetical protein